MNNSPYGCALYYPYIHLNDGNWVKVAALYYEGLERIVPADFITHDSDIVKSLNDEFQFVSNIDPGKKAQEIGDDFLEFARDELANENRRKQIIQTIGTKLPPKSRFRIHKLKMATQLREELPKIGLAKRSMKSSPWYDFEPVTGALYMTCLANQMAESRGLPIITDDPVYQPLIRTLQRVSRYEYVQRANAGHALASMVIESAIPENINSVSTQQVIRFRRKHDDERRKFYNAINNLARDIPKIQESDAFTDCLNHHKRTIDDAVDDLRDSLMGIGIKCATGLLGLSLPSWTTNLIQIKPDWGVHVFGAIYVAVGALLLANGINEYRSKRHSPWSYVLSLEQGLKPNNLLSRLLPIDILSQKR